MKLQFCLSALLLALLFSVSASEAENLWKKGRAFYLKKKYAEAVECYRKAADAGYAPAQNSLGCCYLAGRGVRKNPTMACHYFQKAADQGDPKGINNVGFCYLYGFGYVNYPLFAGDHSRRAADAGLPEAQYNHADLTRLGMGTARNPQRALEYYRKAADAGSLPAIRTLADWYEYGGNGLARDARKALEWKKLSIKKSNSNRSQINE